MVDSRVVSDVLPEDAECIPYMFNGTALSFTVFWGVNLSAWTPPSRVFMDVQVIPHTGSEQYIAECAKYTVRLPPVLHAAAWLCQAVTVDDQGACWLKVSKSLVNTWPLGDGTHFLYSSSGGNGSAICN